jgi:hypothetical protein
MFETTDTLIDWLRESTRHFQKTKDFAKKVRRYYEGDQLDSFIKNVLANRGQPEHYENQIAKHNNSILGFKKERDVEIRIFGRQQSDRASADMLNALVKAITQVSSYEDQVDALDDELSIEGVAIAELSISATGEYDTLGREHKELEIKAVPSAECFLDPFSRAKNYNDDARYLSRAFWIDKDDMYALGFDEKLIEQLDNTNYISDLVDDDLYADVIVRKRILLVYTWYRKYDKQAKKDKFYYCFWSNKVILLQNESPFKADGFPYEVQFLGRSLDPKSQIRYWGLYRDIIPLQDSINFSKLRLQNMLANNKTLVNKGALIDEDIEGFRDEWSLDDAIVAVEDINGIKDVRQNAQIQQILNTIIDSRNQISELLNSNKEMLGIANNRMSGVGQEQRIQTGLVGLSRFIGASDKLQKKIVKKAIPFIEQYYDTQRVVSIIDEDYMQDFITMNEVQRNSNGAIDFEMLPDGKVKPLANNTITVGKYDLIFEARTRSASMSAERLRQNNELLKVLERTNPELVQYLVPDILKDSGSPSARKIRQIIEQVSAQQQNSPEVQRMAQLEQANKQLEMQVKQSQTNLNNAKAQALQDKNKIDLQKAFSSSLIAKANVQAKQDRNLLNAGRNV